MTGLKRFIEICLVLSAAIDASGQTERMLQPSDLKQRTIVTEPVTLKKGYLRAGFNLSYIVQDKYFNKSGDKEYYSNSQWGANYNYEFSLEYGITDRIEIDIFAPFVSNRIENYYMQSVPSLQTSYPVSDNLKGRGLGDCRMMLMYQLIPENENRTTLTAGGQLLLPTGSRNPTDVKSPEDYNIPTGNGNYVAGLSLNARKIHYPYSYSAFANYFYSFWGSKLINPTDVAETKFKMGNSLMAGGSFNLLLNEWIAFANELYYSHSGEEKIENSTAENPSWDIYYMPRLVFQVRRFRISQFVLVPLAGASTEADPDYEIMLQYTF
ncbi:MAG: hypothetical protein ABSG89_00880 [Bacteroidales bacterium]|jgi:hypothetical protein